MAQTRTLEADDHLEGISSKHLAAPTSEISPGWVLEMAEDAGNAQLQPTITCGNPSRVNSVVAVITP